MFHSLVSITVSLLFFCFASVQAQVYVTEDNVQIDRCASAWFISRYMDEQPEFVFYATGETVPEGVLYDVFGGKYFHKGPDCAFTSLVKSQSKYDQQTLQEMNQVVNDVFAWRQGPHSLGVSLRELIDELVGREDIDDLGVYHRMFPVLDALYFHLDGDASDWLPSARASQNQFVWQLVALLSPGKDGWALVVPALESTGTSSQPPQPDDFKRLFLILRTAEKADSLEFQFTRFKNPQQAWETFKLWFADVNAEQTDPAVYRVISKMITRPSEETTP